MNSVVRMISRHQQQRRQQQKFKPAPIVPIHPQQQQTREADGQITNLHGHEVTAATKGRAVILVSEPLLLAGGDADRAGFFHRSVNNTQRDDCVIQAAHIFVQWKDWGDVIRVPALREIAAASDGPAVEEGLKRAAVLDPQGGMRQRG